MYGLRAIQQVLTADQKIEDSDAVFTLRSNALSDDPYTVKMQYSQEYLLIEYEGAFTRHFFKPFLYITFVLAEQLSRHSSSNMRQREYHESHDPELYNHLSQRYSRMCQGERKPLMTQKDGANTYKYWNFTTNQPQIYKCPDKYPNLYFITGKHKLNYCVPCCAQSKAPSEVNKQCLESHTYTRRQSDKKAYTVLKEDSFAVGRHTALGKAFAEQFDY